VVPHVAEDSVTMMYRPDLRGVSDLNVKRHKYLSQWDYTRQRVYLSTSHEFDPRLLFVLRYEIQFDTSTQKFDTCQLPAAMNISCRQGVMK
jgi:hypothetical protein